MSVQIALLSGNRLHLNHGPIDLVISADGEAAQITRAYSQAAAILPNILPELVAQLPLLRAALGGAPNDMKPIVNRPVARSMVNATWPYRETFITPMAAVAGAVAEHVLAAMVEVAELRRAVVNNGGDIALHLAPGERMRAGIVGDLAKTGHDATIEIDSADPVRGLATSGWRGRSLSLGIADAVTVLARKAAAADAAATMIANAVNVDDPAIRRLPASEVRDDSDLGAIPVTVAVGALSADKVCQALENGARRAAALKEQGLIVAAYLQLQGQMLIVGAAGRIAAVEAA